MKYINFDSITIENGATDFKIDATSNKLQIYYGATKIFEIDSSGNVKAIGDVTAFGTIS